MTGMPMGALKSAMVGYTLYKFGVLATSNSAVITTKQCTPNIDWQLG